MSAATFDTLKLVDALEKVNIPREQARAIVDVVRESHDATDVATKADLELLRKDLIIKLGGMLIAGFGAVIGILFKLMG